MSFTLLRTTSAGLTAVTRLVGCREEASAAAEDLMSLGAWRSWRSRRSARLRRSLELLTATEVGLLLGRGVQVVRSRGEGHSQLLLSLLLSNDFQEDLLTALEE